MKKFYRFAQLLCLMLVMPLLAACAGGGGQYGGYSPGEMAHQERLQRLDQYYKLKAPMVDKQKQDIEDRFWYSLPKTEESQFFFVFMLSDQFARSKAEDKDLDLAMVDITAYAAETNSRYYAHFYNISPASYEAARQRINYYVKNNMPLSAADFAVVRQYWPIHERDVNFVIASLVRNSQQSFQLDVDVSDAADRKERSIRQEAFTELSSGQTGLKDFFWKIKFAGFSYLMIYHKFTSDKYGLPYRKFY
jgi:hypothetical protein